MHEEELMEFLLSLAASTSDMEFRSWNGILVEIFYHVFWSWPVSSLVPIQNKMASSSLQQLLSKEMYTK